MWQTRRYRTKYTGRKTRLPFLDIVDERRGRSRLRGLVLFSRVFVGIDFHPDSSDLVLREIVQIKRPDDIKD